MSCKKSDSNTHIKQEKKDIVITEEASNNLISLPFDKENYDYKYDSKQYPNLSKDKHSLIKNIITKYKPEDSQANSIKQFKTGKEFDTYLYFVDGDSSFSELININSRKEVISSLSVSYYYPADITYDTFELNENLIITTFEVNQKSKEKNEVGKYIIQNDGSIKTLFNNRKNKEIDPSKGSAPN